MAYPSSQRHQQQQQGPPGLSRLHLAAALIEYDNDDNDDDDEYAPPGRYRSHRDSAIFKGLQPRPLDRILSHPHPHPHPQTRARPSSGPEGSGPYHPNPRTRDSATMEMLEGRTRQSYEHQQRRLSLSQQEPRPQEQVEEEEVEEVDVSRWGLPEHLVSRESIHPQPRPQSQARPPSVRSASHVPTARPTSAQTTSFDPPRQSRPFPDSRTPDTGAVDMSALDGLEAEDEFGIASALESSQRVRDLVGVDSDSARGPLGPGASVERERERERERIRTRSGGDLGLGARAPGSTDRRVSFNELDMADRPSTSMGLMPTSPRSARRFPTPTPTHGAYGQGSGQSRSAGTTPNPLLVPLPASPTGTSGYLYDGIGRPGSGSFSRHSSYLPPIGFDDTRIADGASPRRGEGVEIEEMEDEHTPNPFAMPAPPPQLGSRFDPKQLDAQRGNSTLSRSRPTLPEPHPSSTSGAMSYRHSSCIPGGQPMDMLPDEQDITDLLRGRRDDSGSGNGIGPPGKVYDEIPTAEEYGKPLRPAKYTSNRPTRLSRHDLLRPKTLVMPSMLADIPPPVSPKKRWEIAPEGFSIGEKPIPAAARTSVLTIGGVARIPLSLSQRTFRSSLLVGGERGEAWVGGAEVEGEVAVGKKEREDLDEDMLERRPGKLYGKSLMDQLEARKQAMKGKQRQFAGDNRPAMMSRGSSGPASTSPTARKGPLLQFDEHGNLHESPTKPEFPASAIPGPGSGAGPSGASAARPHSQYLPAPARPTERLSKSTSIFGVDEVWEREMAKLKIIQANEAAQQRLDREREEEKERLKQEKKDKKKKTKGKGKDKDKGKGKAGAEYAPVALHDDQEFDGDDGFEMSPIKKTADLPPMVTFSPERPPAPPIADQQPMPMPMPMPMPEEQAERLAEDRQRQTVEDESDSEEDVPLSQIRRAAPRPTPPMAIPPPVESEDDDEDADVPLSKLRKPKPKPAPASRAEAGPGPGPAAAAPATSSSSPEKPVLAVNTDFAPAHTYVEGQLPTGETGDSLGLNLSAIDKTIHDLTQPQSTITKPTGGEEEDDDVPLLLRQAHIKATRPVTSSGDHDVDDDDDDVPLGVRQSMRQSTTSFHMAAPPHPGAFIPHHQHHQASPFPYGHGHGQQWGPSPYSQMQMPMHLGYPTSPGYPFPPQTMSPYDMGMGTGMGHPGMPMPPNMAMPPLPNFAMMSDPLGHGQHDNIDNWRKGVAPPSVSGESRG